MVMVDMMCDDYVIVDDDSREDNGDGDGSD
mgnify:CR=1 FL=1